MGWRAARVGVAVVLCVVVGAVCSAAQNLTEDATAAMRDGRYQEAAKLLAEHLRQQPQDARALYNLACCRSRLGDQEEAAEQLESAWKGGFRDLERLRSDPDLETLRVSERGRRLLEGMEKEERERQRLRGSVVQFEATVFASCRVVSPEVVEPGRRYPLVVVLHGKGGSPDNYVGMFLAAGLTPELLVAAPYGPHGLHIRDRVAYSWYPPFWLYKEVVAQKRAESGGSKIEVGQAIEHREQAAAAGYVLAAIEAVSRDYPVDPERVFVLGHSEGGVLAYWLGLEHPTRFRGLIVIGSRLRASAASEARLKRVAGRLEVLVCHSREDRAMSYEAAESSHERLRAAGIDSRLLRYEGGHSLTVPLIKKVAEWIEAR